MYYYIEFVLILKIRKMGKDDFINSLKILNISENELLALSRDCGFIQRMRKIDSVDFMYSLASESMHGIASYNDIAASIESVNGTSISRQAIRKKVKETCVEYFKRVLELVILNKSNNKNISREVHKCNFKRVLIQDSTIIQLPRRLMELFSGVSNRYTTVCNARIQGIYDLLSGKFISFSINSYSKNDQASASEMKINKDDLTLRDRGYLNMDEIKRHLQIGAHCIYRHKINMQFLDFDTEVPIDLLALLKKKGSVDIVIRLNDTEKSAVRIVAEPVDQATADRRRMKAKKDRKGHNPSKIYLELQSWTIFITTITSKQADFNTLLKIYGLRWRIEIIFKSWKSNMHFDHIQNVSKNQLIITIIMRMIMFLIITQLIYNPFKIFIYKKLSRNLSLLKLTKYLIRNPIRIALLLQDIKENSDVITHSISIIARHCVYEKRKRQNFEQQTSILYA
jgi:hypothetical protein